MSEKIAKLSYLSPTIAKDFTNSLQSTGFVILKDSPIDQVLLEEVYALWEVFFKSEERFLYPFDTTTSDGYASEALSETAKGHHVKDLKAFYHLLKHGRCPESVKAASFKLFDQLTPLAEEALGWIQSGLPKPIAEQLSEPLVNMIQDSPNIKLRLIHYPPLTGNEPEGALRAAPHADINLITFLPSATAKGLQAMTKEGYWVDVECDPGDLVVNAGDMLQLCTNQYIKSTIHRVTNPEGIDAKSSRMSMPFFVHPRNDVWLTDSITALDYRIERITENGLAPKEKIA